MKKDLITVCIITKDDEKYILQTLKWLANQSYWKENFEIIIVDWNSKDKTVRIAEKFLTEQWISHKIINEKDYENKRWWVNYWPTFARNVSIDSSNPKSQYIAQIDADCRPDEHWLENLWKKISSAKDEKDIAWAWWPRYVETEWNISKLHIELIRSVVISIS